MKPTNRCALVLALSLMVALSACGRKGDPVAPDDIDPKYPRTYPAKEAAPEPSK